MSWHAAQINTQIETPKEHITKGNIVLAMWYNPGVCVCGLKSSNCLWCDSKTISLRGMRRRENVVSLNAYDQRAKCYIKSHYLI